MNITNIWKLILKDRYYSFKRWFITPSSKDAVWRNPMMLFGISFPLYFTNRNRSFSAENLIPISIMQSPLSKNLSWCTALIVEGLTGKICTFLLVELCLVHYYDMIIWFLGDLYQLWKIVKDLFVTCCARTRF